MHHVSPNFVEENTEQDEKFGKICDFYRLVEVQKYTKRYKCNGIGQDDKKRKKLRDPLVVSKKVFALVERLKKKMRQVFITRAQMRINHFLTETRYFLLEELLLSTILIITEFQKQLTEK